MSRPNSYPPVVGIPLSKLRARSPRGVVRVARAIAEQWANNPALRLLAISEPVFDRNEILFETWDMKAWLDGHGIDVSESSPARRSRLDAATQQGVRLLKQTITQVGLKEPARGALRLTSSVVRRVRNSLGSLDAQAAAPRGPESRSIDMRWRSLREFDAIVSFECYDAIWNWPVENYGCRMIGVFHDAIPLRIHEGQHWNPAAFYGAAGLMANRASVIACDSQSSERDLHAFFPSARHKTQVVYLGHDRQRFLASDEQLANSGGAATMSRPAGKRIAMIGEIEPRKNQAGVLRACQYLQAERPDERITLVLIGDQAPQNPYAFLERMAQQHVNIERLGYVSDSKIGDVLRSCDAFLYPSLWEGFGIPVLEAMSAGVPVVCSDGSSLPEVGGPLAFYCDPHDPRSIAAAVRRALAMPLERRKAWVREAREHAARFTWAACATRLLALVEDVAPPRPASGTREKAVSPSSWSAKRFTPGPC